jgi:hypothetical protein
VVEDPELDHDADVASRRSELAQYLVAADGRRLSELLGDVVRDLDPESVWALATMAIEAYGAEHLAVLGGADGEEQDSVPSRFLAAVRLAEPLVVAGADWLGGDDLQFVDVEVVDEHGRT